jgi:5-aminopentanamidase
MVRWSPVGLRVTVLELPATWGNPERAIGLVDSQLARGPKTDLVLLPEASLAGYVSAARDFDLRPFAEPLDGPTTRACAAVSKRHGAYLIAPLVLAESEAFFNAMVGLAPDGTVAFVYRKRHPWIPETWASPGREAPPLFVVSDVPTTIAICYDAHFAPTDAALQLRSAKLLLFPSAWVDPFADQSDSRLPLLSSIARRFGLWVANANWGPGVVRARGQGGSCVLDPTGAVVATLDADTNRVDAFVG